MFSCRLPIESIYSNYIGIYNSYVSYNFDSYEPADVRNFSFYSLQALLLASFFAAALGAIDVIALVFIGRIYSYIRKNRYEIRIFLDFISLNYLPISYCYIALG